MNIFQQLEAVLADPRCRRDNPELIDPAFDRLSPEPCTLLREFFRRFRGPIGSDVTGLLMLDIVVGDPSIVSITEVVRSRFGLGKQWLIISDILANGMLAYNAKSNEVFRTDFEGGLEMMQNGELQPEWSSLEEFLTWYFQLDEDFPETKK